MRWIRLQIITIFLVGCASNDVLHGAKVYGTIHLDNQEDCIAGISSDGQGFEYALIDFPGNRNFYNFYRAHFDQLTTTIGLRHNPPVMLFYDDRQGPNAFAISSHGPTGSRYRIMFGATMLWEHSKAIPGTDNLNTSAMVAILAHEFGHIAQGVARTRLDSVTRQELMADYLSGWYIAWLDTNGGEWEMDVESVPDTLVVSEDLIKVMYAFYNLGDYQFNSPDHHGSPTQRLAAFALGYRSSLSRTDFWSSFDRAKKIFESPYLFSGRTLQNPLER